MNETADPNNQSPVPAEQNITIDKNFGDGKKILIIEDDLTTAELIRKTLIDYMFEVFQAKHGKDAWDKIRPETTPDVIISDYLMPEMDGFQFFKGLKENEQTNNIPVIFISARKNMEDSLIALGVDAFLSKPIDTPILLQTIQKALLKKPTKKEEEKTEEAPTKTEEKKD